MTYNRINPKLGNSYRGLFITIEGPEGAGKSTQAAMLTEWLLSFGLPVINTREPGDGPIGSQIRQLILSPENVELTAKAEALLYCADRAQHVEKVIRPALAAGAVVVCDRYIDSHLAYQGYGRGLSLEFLLDLNEMAADGLQPDLTLFLSMPPAKGLARANARAKLLGLEKSDRMEQQELEFHQRVVDGYNQIAASNPQRVQIVDGDREMVEVTEEIQGLVSTVLIHRGLIMGSSRDTEIYD